MAFSEGEKPTIVRPCLRLWPVGGPTPWPSGHGKPAFLFFDLHVGFGLFQGAFGAGGIDLSATF
ncbi:MAG TPA: hypothetical protein PLQ00_11735, partial [Thermoguttaceae bacterium]|nr:hypothetical protein [Thermoguttaceae bacterium]